MPTKVRLVKAMVFAVVMYGCESWTIKKAKCWRIDAFELWCWRTLESPLDCKEIQPVHPKENQSWIFIGRTDAEAETPILWPPDLKESDTIEQLNWVGLTGLPGAQMVKNVPAMREIWVQSMGWEDQPEEGVATNSSILTWRIPMGRGAWWGTVHGVTKSQTRLNN